MRIGVDAFNLAADRRGMGRVVRSTLAHLRETGVNVVLVARDSAAARALVSEFDYETSTRRELRAAALDAVWYPWNGMRFDPHAPAAVTVHDLFAFQYPASNFVARRREQSPIRRAVRKADRIFTDSHWTEGQIRLRFGVAQDRITVAHPGVDAFWQPVRALGDTPYMLFVAGPDERKNAAMLFRAFDAAFSGASSPLLVVAGSMSAPDERVLSRIRASYERVKPDDKRLRELYSGAIAVVVPSLAEGYGMPAVEAMACGAPVIAADATALPEACDGAALLVPPSDEAGWTQALRRIAGDAALQESLRISGLERARRMSSAEPANALIEFVRRLREGAR